MLTHLQVQHYGLIQHLELDFKEGLTVITGETGAGKTLVLDAINLILGERLEKDSLLQEDPCSITAHFDISQLPSAQSWLREQDLLIDENDCVIRRHIVTKGRSRCYLNGILVTQQQLKNLAYYLVHQHGQHQHQELFKPSSQRQWLDAYGQYPLEQQAVAKNFKAWQEYQSQLIDLKNRTHQHESDRKLLQYQVEELDALGLGETEVEALELEHSQLLNAQSHQQALFEAASCLSDEHPGAQSALLQAIKHLSSNPVLPPSASTVLESLEASQMVLQETYHTLKQAAEHCEHSPMRCETLEKRLNTIYDIARKHKVKAKALYDYANSLSQQLVTLQASEEEEKALEAAIESAKKTYQQAAFQLSLKRRSAAIPLAEAITNDMQKVNMKGGRCLIDVIAEESHMSLEGIDTICFKANTNPHHEPQAIAKIASGGELARLALCIQGITASIKKTPTLIFDEIDVGVGGKTGALIGQALKKLSEKTQVICITHLPQVAAFGDQHIEIFKETLHLKTTSNAHYVKGEAREQELARMLGGVDIGPEAIANARHLLATP